MKSERSILKKDKEKMINLANKRADQLNKFDYYLYHSHI